MSPAAPTPPLVLVFSATDPSSGAGMQADILTLASLGCHPLCVVTAVTVQDTVGVESVLPIDAEVVERQARAILEDMPVAAFKVGLLGSVENVVAVAEIAADYPDIPLVFDPVLASGRGDDLTNEDMRSAMQELLLPQTTLLTPNSLEARRLTPGGEEEEGEDDTTAGHPGLDLHVCAHKLVEMGCQYVLVTGTHENTPQVVNTLYGDDGRKLRADRWDRLPGSYHGSGCTLASAIAACLASGTDIETAVKEAQDYTWQALAKAFRPGMGQYIPDRLFWARDEGENGAEPPAEASTEPDDLITTDTLTVSGAPAP